MRRKTLINNLSTYFKKSKTELEKVLKDYDANIRAENLSTDDFEKLTILLAPFIH